MRTYTYVAHDLDMGDLPTNTAHITGESRQDKVSWFRERLPNQERPGLIALTEQLFSVRTRQVAMVPPEDSNAKGKKVIVKFRFLYSNRCSRC